MIKFTELKVFIRLQSKSAVAFLNSSFVGEHKIDAIVYDLNSPGFEAKMTVYGYDRQSKPAGTYVPIVLSQKNRW